MRPLGDVCGNSLSFTSSPATPAGNVSLAGEPELHFPEFRGGYQPLQSYCRRYFPEISERNMKNPQFLFSEVIPKDTFMGYTAISK